MRLLTLIPVLVFVSTRVCVATAEVPPSARSSGLSAAFASKGAVYGAPVFLRIYKQSSEIELWVQAGRRYRLIKTYPICRWSGVLGPKRAEGDRQTPEGYYSIGAAGLVTSRRWRRGMQIDYPNAFDRIAGRTGSAIYVHGGCGSIGCYGLNDADVEEIYGVAVAALQAGQIRIPVLSLPFRASIFFTSRRPGENSVFWHDLHRAEMLFDRDRIPPSASVCDGRYVFSGHGRSTRPAMAPLKNCRPLRRALSAREIADARARAAGPFAFAPNQPPQQAAEDAARVCNPADTRCRSLRAAVRSDVWCPKKYSRCQAAIAAYTKSVDCPLKFPRCRSFAVATLTPDTYRATNATPPQRAKR